MSNKKEKAGSYSKILSIAFCSTCFFHKIAALSIYQTNLEKSPNPGYLLYVYASAN